MIAQYRPGNAFLDAQDTAVKHRHLVLSHLILFLERQRVVCPIATGAGLVEQRVEPVKGVIARLPRSERQAAPDLPNPIDKTRTHAISIRETCFHFAPGGKVRAGPHMTALAASAS